MTTNHHVQSMLFGSTSFSIDITRICINITDFCRLSGYFGLEVERVDFPAPVNAYSINVKNLMRNVFGIE